MTYPDALNATLAAEHAAVYVYEALGAQTSQSAAPGLYATVVTAFESHRARRDELVDRITDTGGEPVASEVAYELPADLSTTDAVTARALELERACAATYGYLVGSSPAAQRRWAIRALTESALREITLGGRPRPLPGGAGG